MCTGPSFRSQSTGTAHGKWGSKTCSLFNFAQVSFAFPPPVVGHCCCLHVPRCSPVPQASWGLRTFGFGCVGATQHYYGVLSSHAALALPLLALLFQHRLLKLSNSFGSGNVRCATVPLTRAVLGCRMVRVFYASSSLVAWQPLAPLMSDRKGKIPRTTAVPAISGCRLQRQAAGRCQPAGR